MLTRYLLTVEVEQEDDMLRVLGVKSVKARPLAPTNLRSVTVTETSVEIIWDNLGDALSWNVYRNGAFLVNVVSPTRIDNTVAAGTDYTYTVRGVNSAGEGDVSNELNVRTDDPLILNPPTGLALDLLTANKVGLSWDNPGNVIEWDLRRGGVVKATVSQPSYTDITVTGGNSYSYDVIARLAGGDSAPCTALVVNTPANIAPQWQLSNGQIFAVSVGDNFSLDLSGACIDPDSNPMTFQLVSGGPPGIGLSGTILSGTFTTAGSYASCLLRANDGTDTSDVTIDFEVAALPDTTVPTTPQLDTPIVTGASVSMALLTPSTDASGIAFYRMLRKEPGSSVFTTRAEIQQSDFPYVESGLAAGTYQFRTRAFDASPAQNFSAFSDTHNVVIAAQNPNPDTPINFSALLNNDIASLSWSPGPSGAAVTGYDLEFSIEANGGSATGPWTDFSTSGTTATHSSLPTGKVWYRIRALSVGGASGYTSVIFVTVGNVSSTANFIIQTSDGNWDGSANHTPVGGGAARAVQPGDVIELESGTHPFRDILRCIGSAANPVTIRGPTTGQAIIRRGNSGSSTTGGFGLNLSGCRFGVLDGFTTHASVPVESDGKRHSIKFTYKANASVSNKDTVIAYLKFSGTNANGNAPYNVTRDWTIRQIHIDGGWNEVAGSSLSATSGIGISTNHAYKRNDFPGQWQENMILEHCLIENMGGEGTYVGPNPFLAPNPEVPLRYIKHRYMFLKNIGGNGISCKSHFDGIPGGDEAHSNSIHDCIFIKCGRDAGANGTVACTANSSRTAIYNNWFEDCGFGAFNWQASEGTEYGFASLGVEQAMRGMAFNNVVLRCGALGDQTAINVTKHTSVPASFAVRVRIFCNTVIDHGGGGEISAKKAHTGEGFIRNNFLPSGSIDYGPFTNPGSNVTSGAPVDKVGTYEAGNLNLAPASPTTITGTLGSGTPGTWSTSVDLPPFDFFNAARPAPRCAGAIEV